MLSCVDSEAWWALPPSRLEELARVSPEALRAWLRLEVERRRAEVADELRDVAPVA